ncbi:MAG: ankyrin repeat domain-containing protein [Fimbriimonadales bacterium]
MSKQLPKQPSLEHLKNEAKDLLRLARAGDPEAYRQVGESRLANAQLAVAREYGFPSWAKLKRAVEGYADQRDALFDAIRAGDRERVTAALRENPGLVYALDPNSFGSTTIAAAAQRNDRRMIDLLLDRGADIDARSDWWAGSFGALDFADEETSRFLLSRGATLTAHAAARLDMADEVKQLIARHPDAVHERGGDGQYPLHFAKTPKIVDILLDAGAEIDARDLDHEGTPAQTLALDEPVLRRLVERGAKTDIFMAIALDDLELVKSHLADDPEALGRRTDEPGNPMIPQAPGAHRYTYVFGFVTPIEAAIALGREQIYDYLFEQLPPRHGLIAACCKGDREQALAVIDTYPGVMSELTDEDQRTLVALAKVPRPEAVSLMLELGFDVEAEDGEKFTAIHWASFLGRDDLIEIILPYKPDLEKRNRYGGTVLTTGMYGSVHGWNRSGGNFARSTELLIKAGAKLPDRASGSPEVVAVLRRFGVPG